MSKTNKTEERFEALWLEFQRTMGLAMARSQEALVRRRAAKRYAYRAMVKLVAMRDQHQPQMLDRIKGEGFTGKACLDDFLEKCFQPLRLLNESWRDLLQAIEQKMTEKQYLTTGDAYGFLQKKKAAEGASLVETPLPEAPPESLPRADRDKQWQAIAEAALAQNAELKTENRELKHRNAVLERKMGRMQKVVA